jgi:predicted DNA-binding transcriptional regulator AlpA
MSTAAIAQHFRPIKPGPSVALLPGLIGEYMREDPDIRHSPPLARHHASSPSCMVEGVVRARRVESWSPSSNWVPPWQDKATLCMCLCISENTVDTWVRQGLLPPPRKRGGKLMWKWSEVEKYLEGEDTQSPEELAERIRNATRRATVEGK